MMSLINFEHASEWIFLSKNFMKFTDEYRIGNVPGESFTVEETKRRLMQADPDKVAESIRRAQLKVVRSEESEDITH